jgi:hypothetical protein
MRVAPPGTGQWVRRPDVTACDRMSPPYPEAGHLHAQRAALTPLPTAQTERG